MKAPDRASPAIQLLNDIRRANPEAVSRPENGNLTAQDNQDRPMGEFRTDRSQALGEAVDFLHEFPIRKAVAINRSIHELRRLQGEGRTPYYGVLNLYDTVDKSVSRHNSRVRATGRGSVGQTLRVLDDFWDRHLGSVILPANVDLSSQALGPDLYQLGKFFSEDRMFAPREGRRELRGPRYFVTATRDLPINQQLENMKADVASALSVASSIDRDKIRTGGHFLAYLGVMDYLKIHALTLFHALTYDERYLQFVNAGDRKRYQELRGMSAGMVEESVRRYYQTFLGLPYDDQIDQKKYFGDYKKVTKYVAGQREDSIWSSRGSAGDYRLKYPEVNHPLVFALGAQEAVNAYPDIEVVVGIPSGGTELAYCTQLLYELQGRQVDVIQIPVSQRFHQNPRDLAAMIQRDYGQILAGRSVLIEDDNASTGTTVSYVGRAVAKLASDVAVHTAEFDGRRLDKQQGSEFFSSAASPTTMSIAEIQTSQDGKFMPVYLRSIFDRMRRYSGSGRKNRSQNTA